MPQMMPLSWVAILFISTTVLWLLIPLTFFLYQPHLDTSRRQSLSQVNNSCWKW
nr:ATP synthase F0 subunit 8 [Artemia salina]